MSRLSPPPPQKSTDLVHLTAGGRKNCKILLWDIPNKVQSSPDNFQNKLTGLPPIDAVQQPPQTRAVLLHSHPGGGDQGEDQQAQVQGQYNGLVTRAAYNHSYLVIVETVRLGETHFEWVSPL